MLLDQTQEKLYKWMTWAFYFLMLGFLASPTIVSLYHILFVVPAILVFIKGEKIQLSKSAWSLLLLTLWGLIATLVNAGSIIKPFKAYQELQYYLFGALFIQAFHFYFKRTDHHMLKKFIKIVGVVVVVAFFVGISKAWFGFDPVKMRFGDYHVRSGGFTNYMRYGYASSFLFLLGIGAYLNREKLKNIIASKWFYAGTLFSFCAIFTSQTRGALLGLIIAIPFLFLRYKPRFAKIAIGLGSIFLAIVLYISFSGVNTGSRFLNIKDGSNTVRMSQFLSAVKAIEENPVFGLGADQFSYNVTRLKEKYDIWAKHYSGHAHNIFLEHGANYGLVGLLIFTAFLVLWFIEMIKRRDDLGWVIASYILAFTAAGMVENLFDNTNSHLIFFLYTFSQLRRG
jgi:O-antigen ligase